MTNKEIHTALSNLKIGDKLAINDFKAKYTVCGLSPRFALAHYGKYYTILSRVPVNCAGYNHNGVRNGDFVCAPHWWAFGYVGTWISKWMISSLVLKENVMPYITEHIAERLGGDVYGDPVTTTGMLFGAIG